MYDDYSSGKLIKVYLPQYIIDIFERDMENFEIKRNNKPNLSRFCNLIFSYMKDRYMSEHLKLKDRFIENWLGNGFKEILKKEFILSSQNSDKISKIVENSIKNILEEIYKPEKMNYSDYISFRLDNENGSYFSIIERELGKNMTASDYFRNIFLSYSLKPQFEREKIICYSNYEKIQKAIKNKNPIYMKINGKSEIYEQIPCFIKQNKEEMFNYVIILDNKRKIKNPRLSSFNDVKIVENKKYSLDKEESEKLEKLKKNFDPMSLSESEIKVRLSKNGQKLFKRIIYNRPTVERVEDENIYVFSSSPEKIRAYFFRYGKSAEVIYPKELAETFKREYREAYEMYEKNSD